MSFATKRPKLYELFRRSDQQHADNYFVYLGDLILDPSYQPIEDALGMMDSASLEALFERAAPMVVRRDKQHNRHWTELWDTLSEAKGYSFLQNQGYSSIRFLPCKKTPQPDLFAEFPSPGAYLEVKCIRQSDSDLSQSSSVRTVSYAFSDGMKRKIRSVLEDAKRQCGSVDDARRCKWFLYLCIDVDSDIAMTRSNFPKLKEFLDELSTDALEIHFESGVWS
jgi:hypothetical protein